MELRLRNSFVDMTGLFFALTIIFAIGLFALILTDAYQDNIKPKLNDALTSSTAVDANANVTKVLDDTGSGLTKLNPLFPFLLIGVFAFVLIMALMTRSFGAFLFIGLIVLAVALILAAVFSNVYEAIGDTDEYSDTSDELGVIKIFQENLPLIILILFIAIGIILYALPKGGGQI